MCIRDRRKKSHYEYCPKSKIYRDRVKELRGLLQEEPTLEAGSEEFLASAAAIRHLQVKLGPPYDTAQDRDVLKQIVGKGATLKKTKPVRKKIVKAPANHPAYKNQVDQREFAPHSGTAESTKVFFMPMTRGGGAAAAKKVQQQYEKDYEKKNQSRKEQQEAAKVKQRARRDAAAAAREMLEEELADKIYAERREKEAQQAIAISDSAPFPPNNRSPSQLQQQSSDPNTQPLKRSGTGVLKAEELQRLLLLELAKPAKVPARPTAKNSKATRAPQPVLAIFNIIRANLPQRWQRNSNDLTGGNQNKEGMEWLENNFRGELFFRVPRLPPSVKPSPAYHSVMGLSFYQL